MFQSLITQRKFFFLSKTEKSSISEFISFSDFDCVKNISFNNFKITDIIKYSPDIIVIDDYFTDSNFALLKDLVINKFPNTHIFVISPIYAKYDRVITSFFFKKHHYSNLSEDIIKMIDSSKGSDPSSYLSAC